MEIWKPRWRLVSVTGALAGLVLLLGLALAGGFLWLADRPARAQVVRHCGDSDNLFEWPTAVVDLAPDSGLAGTEFEVDVTQIPWDPMSRRIEILWHWDPDAGEGALIGDAIIGMDETSVTVDAVVPEWAETGSNTVTACWLRPSSDTWYYKSAPFVVTELTPTPVDTPTPSPTATLTPSPVATPTLTPSPTTKQVHGCPKKGQWAIAVWWGSSDTDIEEALDACGEGAVDAAYALDPDSQGWLRWFADHPQLNTLHEVSEWQGLIAFGKAEPEPSAEPPPSAANEMHNCPEPGQWAIAVWEGANGIDTGEALAACEEEVDAAYYIDPDTQNWLRWFAEHPEFNTLDEVSNRQAVMALGKATLKPKRIAFVAHRDDNAEIYVMNADGTGQTRLTNNPAPDLSPAWSPNHSKIAFHSGRAGDYEIYVMNADGSGQTNLTNSPGSDDMDPAWSPDGTRIAFTRAEIKPAGPGQTTHGEIQIYVMNADGTGQTNVSKYPAGLDLNPTWAPDGTKIAFESWQVDNYEIYVMNADGLGRTNLTNYPSHDVDPAWSPDGTKIAFTTERGGNKKVYVMNADGTGQTDVAKSPAGINDLEPAWSPDGSQIAFTSSRDGNGEIYVMNADGSAQTNITNYPAVQPFWTWLYDDDRPAWSP